MQPAPDPHRDGRWQRPPALISTTDPLDGPVPARHQPARSRTVEALLALERHNRGVRRMLARAAADHLFQAASLLREVPSADAVVLSAAGTTELLYALDDAAHTLGGALPAGFAVLADQLPAWAAAVKRQHQAAASAGDRDRRALVPAPRWPRRRFDPARGFE
jgi:hypothetical protein